MYIFFDTETTGKPLSWRAPMKELNNWPRVIQLAWQATDVTGETIGEGNYLIKPDGWVIPVEPFWVDHGFNTLKSNEEGVPIGEVLPKFMDHLHLCDYLVSHNMEFDYNVLGAELLRAGVSANKRLARICTKEESTSHCKIPFEGRTAYGSRRDQQWKWPKLDELHNKLFGQSFANAHDAMGDVTALRNCFFELVRLGVITPNARPA